MAGLYRPVGMGKTFDREARGPCFVMPASFFKFRDVLPAFHGIGRLFFCTRFCRHIRRSGGRSERRHFPQLRFLRLPGLMAGPNGIPSHAVPFLYVPVRVPPVGGPILRIRGRVR